MPDVDPGLLAKWLAARSVARQLSLPVPDHSGLRVDTKSETESRRYVFAEITPGLIALGSSIDDPLALLKVCATAGALANALPEQWQVEPTGSVMTCDHPDMSSVTPIGYQTETQERGEVIRCVIRAVGDVLAA